MCTPYEICSAIIVYSGYFGVGLQPGQIEGNVFVDSKELMDGRHVIQAGLSLPQEARWGLMGTGGAGGGRRGQRRVQLTATAAQQRGACTVEGRRNLRDAGGAGSDTAAMANTLAS